MGVSVREEGVHDRAPAERGSPGSPVFGDPWRISEFHDASEGYRIDRIRQVTAGR